MSNNESTATDIDLCPVCHEEIRIYAIGQCNHPICFRCSVRMRFLCEQMYCPICRSDIKQVAFLTSPEKFETVKLSSLCMDRRTMIFSESEEIRDKYGQLLKHKCSYCDPPKEFESFQQLKAHTSRDHKLMSCKLCTDNLKLFSHERKFYRTFEMVRHKKVGDPDDKSYKGHPLCQFCDERYFDNDALVIHLRKDHFYCHFCEADGKTGEFFCNYEDLKQHFKESHYICEEGDCAKAQWTNAFKSDIDLKAHIAQTHSKGLDKHQAKRLKTLDLDFAQPGRRQRSDRMNRDQKNREEFQAAQVLSATLASVQKQGHIHIAKQGFVDMIRGKNPNPPAQNEPLPCHSDFPDLNGSVPKQPKETPKVEAEKKAEEKQSEQAQASNDRFAFKAGRGANYLASQGDFPMLPSQKPAQQSGQSKLKSTQMTKNPWNKTEAKSVSKEKPKPTEIKSHMDSRRSDRPLVNGRMEVLAKKSMAEKKVENLESKKPESLESKRPESTENNQPVKSNNGKKEQPMTKVENSDKVQMPEDTSKATSVQDGPKVGPVVTSMKQLTKLYKDWAFEDSDPKIKNKNRESNKKKSKVENVLSQDQNDSSKQPKSPKKSSKGLKQPTEMPVQTTENGIPDQSASNSSPKDSNPQLGPPPGFSQPKTLAPPPGFMPKSVAPPGFAPKSDSQLLIRSSRPFHEGDFPSLSTDSSANLTSKILKVASPSLKIITPGTWPLASEIPALESETPEQRLSRLILIEKDQTALESLKLLLLKLNQGVTEPEDFYASCSKLLTSSVLALTFKDISACVSSAKDRAKVLAIHQKQLSN